MLVTAAPSSEDSSTRRRALPRVTPYPAWRGPASYLAYVPASSTGSICGFSSSIMKAQLPRVVLDHELLVEVERHLVAAGQVGNGARELGRVERQPLGRLVRAKGLLGQLERLARTPALANLDAVTGLQLMGGDVARHAVDGEVAVIDELPSLSARRREAHPVDDVVETQLQRSEQALAGHAGAGLRGVEVVPELALEDAVHAADLLLLAELQPVVADLAPTDAVLAGRRRTALERALLGIAAGALQVELRALPTAQATDGFGVASHGLPSPIRLGAAWGRGSRCGGWA